jgi:hypothetical protein
MIYRFCFDVMLLQVFELKMNNCVCFFFIFT